jgi:hypothetical protein
MTVMIQPHQPKPLLKAPPWCAAATAVAAAVAATTAAAAPQRGFRRLYARRRRRRIRVFRHTLRRGRVYCRRPYDSRPAGLGFSTTPEEALRRARPPGPRIASPWRPRSTPSGPRARPDCRSRARRCCRKKAPMSLQRRAYSEEGPGPGPPGRLKFPGGALRGWACGSRCHAAEGSPSRR